jgi:4-carboxymuconolactone decarboxylase
VSGGPPPRLAPLPRAEWDEDVEAAVRSGLGGLPPEPVPNVVGTLVHHPKLAGAYLTYNTMLLRAGTLDARARELMILRVAWRTGATYEWLQHVRMARRYGVSDEEIAAVGAGAEAPVWAPLEADLLAATDQLIDRYCIDDATWSRLAEQLDERQLLEAVFVVGTYTCLAMAFNSFGLELDADLEDMSSPAMPPPSMPPSAISPPEE